MSPKSDYIQKIPKNTVFSLSFYDGYCPNTCSNQFSLNFSHERDFFVWSSLIECDWNQTIRVVILEESVFFLNNFKCNLNKHNGAYTHVARTSAKEEKKKLSSSKSVNDLQKKCVFIAVEIMARSDFTVKWLSQACKYKNNTETYS